MRNSVQPQRPKELRNRLAPQAVPFHEFRLRHPGVPHSIYKGFLDGSLVKVVTGGVWQVHGSKGQRFPSGAPEGPHSDGYGDIGAARSPLSRRTCLFRGAPSFVTARSTFLSRTLLSRRVGRFRAARRASAWRRLLFRCAPDFHAARVPLSPRTLHSRGAPYIAAAQFPLSSRTLPRLQEVDIVSLTLTPIFPSWPSPPAGRSPPK
jgi:hypothetical protein